jgi:hypothetical protein
MVYGYKVPADLARSTHACIERLPLFDPCEFVDGW